MIAVKDSTALSESVIFSPLQFTTVFSSNAFSIYGVATELSSHRASAHNARVYQSLISSPAISSGMALLISSLSSQISNRDKAEYSLTSCSSSSSLPDNGWIALGSPISPSSLAASARLFMLGFVSFPAGLNSYLINVLQVVQRHLCQI